MVGNWVINTILEMTVININNKINMMSVFNDDKRLILLMWLNNISNLNFKIIFIGFKIKHLKCARKYH